jgi:hypothetical protein
MSLKKTRSLSTERANFLSPQRTISIPEYTNVESLSRESV